MRKAILFILATMMMASCAEHQVFDDVALDAQEHMKKTENFNDLMAQARWGDGNAYLKLADYYGVTVEYILGRDESEQKVEENLDKQILFNTIKGMSDDEARQARAVIEALIRTSGSYGG